MSIPFVACLALTAHFYALPPRVLPAIHAVEGGSVGAIHENANGTQDFGVMQINSLWLQPLATYTRLTTETVRQRLINDPCFNIAAAGLILKTYLIEARGDVMTAIGFYHSHTQTLRIQYQLLVLQSADRLFTRR